MNTYEHHKRSLAKTLGFHALIIAADLIIVFFITKKINITLEVIVLTNVISGLIYFFHERAWNRVHWGRSKVEIKL